MNKKRRNLLLASLGVGALLPAKWSKPIVNSVLTPAHAQTSPPPPPPPPEDVCPMIVVGNVTTGPVSGSGTPPTCSVTFDIFSGDAATTLSITDVTVTSAADTTVSYDGADTFAGPVTVDDSANGVRVVWRGPATNAPFCSPVEPITDVTFTITATCAAATDMATFSQDFALTAILA